MSYVTTEFYARRSLSKRIREHMRDYAELNTLTDGEENSDAMIESALDVLVETVNSRPPPIGVISVRSIPLDIAIDFCVSWLLESVAILMMRNDLQFTAGGLTVAMDQYRMYQQVAAERRARAEANLTRWKASVNMQQAVDDISGIYSDWSIVNASRYYWRESLTSV